VGIPFPFRTGYAAQASEFRANALTVTKVIGADQSDFVQPALDSVAADLRKSALSRYVPEKAARCEAMHP
jgi:hypothetical protein